MLLLWIKILRRRTSLCTAEEIELDTMLLLTWTCVGSQLSTVTHRHTMKLENNRYESSTENIQTQREMKMTMAVSWLAGRGKNTAAATFNCKRGAFIEVSKRSRIEREKQKEEETTEEK